MPFEVALVRARVAFSLSGDRGPGRAHCPARHDGVGDSPVYRGVTDKTGAKAIRWDRVELTGSRQALPRSDGQALGRGRLAQVIVEAGEARRRARELLHFECTGQMDGIKAPQGAALRELSGPPRHFRG